MKHDWRVISLSGSGDWECRVCGKYTNGGPHDGGGYFPERGTGPTECPGRQETVTETSLIELCRKWEAHCEDYKAMVNRYQNMTDTLMAMIERQQKMIDELLEGKQ